MAVLVHHGVAAELCCIHADERCRLVEAAQLQDPGVGHRSAQAEPVLRTDEAQDHAGGLEIRAAPDLPRRLGQRQLRCVIRSEGFKFIPRGHQAAGAHPLLQASFITIQEPHMNVP